MKQSIQIIKRSDPRYPLRLRPFSNMPETLYVIGTLPDDHLPSVGIVGARLCDQYGKRVAEEFAEILAANGIQIISGMAIGIDSLSQKAALRAHGKTFAILGSGADVCYPSGNQSLYEELCRTGGVISEQPPGSPPLRAYFPQRNRIISAFSDVLLVCEAREHSGSLITADQALEQGKTVFAIPGRVGDVLSDGCNRLIAQGAGIAYSPEPILEELARIHEHLSYPEEPLTAVSQFSDSVQSEKQRKEKRVLDNSTLSPHTKQIYQILSWNEAQSSDQICQTTKLPPQEVSVCLMDLLLLDAVFMPSLNHYQKR